MGRGNQCIELVIVLYCTLPAISKQLLTFPHKVQRVKPPTSDMGGECVTNAHCGR